LLPQSPIVQQPRPQAQCFPRRPCTTVSPHSASARTTSTEVPRNQQQVDHPARAATSPPGGRVVCQPLHRSGTSDSARTCCGYSVYDRVRVKQRLLRGHRFLFTCRAFVIDQKTLPNFATESTTEGSFQVLFCSKARTARATSPGGLRGQPCSASNKRRRPRPSACTNHAQTVARAIPGPMGVLAQLEGSHTRCTIDRCRVPAEARLERQRYVALDSGTEISYAASDKPALVALAETLDVPVPDRARAESSLGNRLHDACGTA